MLKNKLLTASVAVALALLTALAQADVLVAHARNGNFIFTIDVNNSDTQTVVPLDNAGLVQSATLAVPANARFIVSYTAECAVDSTFTNTRVFLNLDIWAINQATGLGTALPPTNTAGDEDAFCTSNSTPGFAGWAMNAVNALGVNLPAGNYKIEVRANIQGANGYGTGSLGDSSLVIWQ